MVTVLNLAQQSAASPREAVVYAPSFFRDDEALLSALRQGQRGARAVFFRRHVDDVELLLSHLLGAEGPALVEAVFSEAFFRIRKYDGEADELDTWLLRLAVRRVRSTLTRRRWLRLLPKALLPKALHSEAQIPKAHLPATTESAGRDEASPLQRTTYALLRDMAPNRAVMLALHWFAELPIEEVAGLCDESLIVVRQQLLIARGEFLELAWGHADLRPWICNVVSQG